MDRLLDVIMFDVWDDPDVSGIFSQRVAGILAGLWSFEILLSWILLGNSDRVEIENVIVCFGEPKNSFVPAGESTAAMQSVLEVPYDAIAQSESEVFANLIDEHVQREDLAVLRYMVP